MERGLFIKRLAFVERTDYGLIRSPTLLLMKTVSYSGPTIELGRFGSVDDGALLQLTEAEYAGITDDSRFTLLSRRRAKTEASPLGTPFFDLRSVEWESNNLDSNLVKSGKATLKNIAEAINFVGGELVVTEHDNDDLIADAIGAEARYFGWDKLGKEARLALGATDSAVAKGATDANVAVKAAKAPVPVAPSSPEPSEEEAASDESTEEPAAKRRRR